MLNESASLIFRAKTMKTFLTSFVLLLSILNLHAQFSPDVGWVRTVTTPSQPNEVAAEWLDVWTKWDGGTHALGYYYDDLQIDGDSIVENPTSDDYLFLVKYNGWDGAVLWSATITAPDGPLPFQFGSSGKICGDAEGNVYVSGNFLSNTVDFGNGVTLEKSCLFGCEELFLAKYNNNGVLLWAKSFKAGNASSHTVGGMDCDAEGNVLFSGTYGGNAIDFGTPLFNFNNLPGNGFFLSKLNSNGEPLWVNFLHSVSNRAEAMALVTASNGNVFVTGRYGNGDVQLDADHLLPQYADQDWFLACYNLAGDVLWAKNLHSPIYLDVLDLSTDDGETAYLAVDFSAELYSGTDLLLETQQPYSAASASITPNVFEFLNFVEYNNPNNYPIMSVRGIYGTLTHYSGGYFTDDAFQVGNTTVYNAGCSDIIMSTETVSSPFTYGGAGCEGIINYSHGSAIAQDESFFTYITGIYQNGLNFDGYQADGSGLFVARLNTSIINTSEPSEFTAFEISPNPSNGTFTLYSNNGNLDGILRVFGASGKLVFEKQINTTSENINLDLPNGIYMLSLVMPQGISSKKMQVLRN